MCVCLCVCVRLSVSAVSLILYPAGICIRDYFQHWVHWEDMVAPL